MKIRQLRAEFFHADRRTDGRTDRHMTKLIVAFRNFANAPKTVAKILSDMAINDIYRKVQFTTAASLNLLKP